MTLYTALGRFSSSTDLQGNHYPVIESKGCENLMDVSEMLIWSALSNRFLELDHLTDLYDKRTSTLQLVSPKPCAAYIDRMLQRDLIMSGTGDTGHDALYDLLSNLYIKPMNTSLSQRIAQFLKLLFKHGQPLKLAAHVLRRDRRSAYEKRIMDIAHQNLLSTAEIITCIEDGQCDVSSDDKVLAAIYGDAFTTCDNIAYSARQTEAELPCLVAVANLYIRQQITLERI